MAIVELIISPGLLGVSAGGLFWKLLKLLLCFCIVYVASTSSVKFGGLNLSF
ncbi:hypothetical protein CDL12_06430 [Handroanthus impetiginosus]|uniref:Uncharacterized protein n=1 Tax=Handroanthus impetiginosus TaxID=429701 RepID=A0A2G9HTN4_9LAMI|nr:hypothetical protein CDL12_06430 [Handroanthus impetiginosus]